MASTRRLYEPVVTKCHNTHLSPDEPNLLGTVDFSRPNSSAERTELDRVYTAGPSVVLSTPFSFPSSPFPFLSLGSRKIPPIYHRNGIASLSPARAAIPAPRSGWTHRPPTPPGFAFAFIAQNTRRLPSGRPMAGTSERDPKKGGSSLRVTWTLRNIANPTTFRAELVTKGC